MITLLAIAVGITLNAAILAAAFRLAAPPTEDDTPEARYRRYERHYAPAQSLEEMTIEEIAAAVQHRRHARIAAKAAGIPDGLPPSPPLDILEREMYGD